MKQKALSPELPKTELEDTQLSSTIWTCTIKAFVYEKKTKNLYAYNNQPWKHLIKLTVVELKNKKQNEQHLVFDIHRATAQDPEKQRSASPPGSRSSQVPSTSPRLCRGKGNRTVAKENTTEFMPLSRRLLATIPKDIFQSQPRKAFHSWSKKQTQKLSAKGMVGRTHDV